VQVLHGLPKFKNPDMLVGTETSDDAGVYRLRPDLAIVNTVDFFTPIVDDPYIFGQISAANSLSDVYAMGGEPKTCMNIVCFPKGKMDIEILGEILKGGADKVIESGAVIIGGHSIIDEEIKFGMAVTGVQKSQSFRGVRQRSGQVDDDSQRRRLDGGAQAPGARLLRRHRFRHPRSCSGDGERQRCHFRDRIGEAAVAP
jgi:selenium donor protein